MKFALIWSFGIIGASLSFVCQEIFAKTTFMTIGVVSLLLTSISRSPQAKLTTESIKKPTWLSLKTRRCGRDAEETHEH